VFDWHFKILHASWSVRRPDIFLFFSWFVSAFIFYLTLFKIEHNSDKSCLQYQNYDYQNITIFWRHQVSPEYRGRTFVQKMPKLHDEARGGVHSMHIITALSD